MGGDSDVWNQAACCELIFSTVISCACHRILPSRRYTECDVTITHDSRKGKGGEREQACCCCCCSSSHAAHGKINLLPRTYTSNQRHSQ